MATSIASQLQAIRSVIQTESEARKRPITRPSVLFDPKEAADIDVDTIFSIALAGLEVLIGVDERFRSYKNNLFSHKTKELDRELLTEAENTRINSSIASYLRLLSGHVELPALLKTLEYLIRRYKVHVYNTEDLVLCTLPYHDTHVFARIVQLLDLRNNRWKFLEGVKTSGAPPPRHVLVQQCIRDMGVLDALCNYASPAKKYQPSRPVVNLCTTVVVEVLGSLATVDSDVVRRILPFVVSGLQPVARGGSDHKAGALMIVALLANKVALSPKLVKSLIWSIAEVACEDAKDATNLLQFHLSLMTLVSIVQLQPVDLLPKKALEIMRETSDIVGTLVELAKEYNIDKFLVVLIESLIEYSSSDDTCHLLLISILETIPVKGFVDHVVSKILSICKKKSQMDNNSTKSGSVSWAKRILMVVNKNYPQELHRLVQKFLEDNKVQSIKDDATFGIFCSMLDGSQDLSADISHSKIWFALHHPRAEVRCAALRDLNACSILKTNDANPQMLENIQDAVLSQLLDNDLTIVQAALSVNGLAGLVSPSDLVKALGAVSKKCFSTLMSSSADKAALAYDVTVSFLRIVLPVLNNNADFIEKVAAIMFPCLIVLPKTEILSLKVLELAREINWPFFHNLVVIPIQETKLQQEVISAVNTEIVNSLAETFLKCPDEYMPWLIESSHDSDISKTLFFMVMMQSFIMANSKSEQFAALFDACFYVLRTEWEVFDSANDEPVNKEFKKETFHWNSRELIDQLLGADVMRVNRTILICIFWRLVEGLVSMSIAQEYDNNWISNKIGELFLFFSSSKNKHVFKEHLHHLVKNCSIPPVEFLSAWFTKEDVPEVVQVESLNCLAYICAEAEDSLVFQLLANFPLLFVPLGSDAQDVKVAAMNCIEHLSALARRVDHLSKKNGSNANWYCTLGDLLGVIVQQKRLILSDKTFLPSFFTSLLGSSRDSLRVPANVERRFNGSTKEKILAFILSGALQCSTFAKLTVISLLKGLGNMIMLVKDVQLLLSQLLKRRSQCCLEADEGSLRLSKTEIKILCILLEICATCSPLEGDTNDDFLLRALQLDGLSSDDDAVIKPCITALQKLNCQFYSGLTAEKQDLLFQELVCLFRSNNGDIQNATRDALVRIKITCSMVVRIVEFIFKQKARAVSSFDGRKKRKSNKCQDSNLNANPVCKRESILGLLSSLLEILLLKKDISNREQLVGPLFELLERILSDEFVPSQDKWIQGSSGISQTLCATLIYIKQTLLSILEDIIGSIIEGIPLEGETAKKINIRLLVGCARSENDSVTRNHVFSLLSVIAKVSSEKVVEHLVDIITVVGESTILQTDSYSQRVFEDLISAVVPCWLAKTDNPDELLQIFVNVLPEVAEHRRQSIVVSLLRNLGEQNSMAPLLIILFHSLVSKKGQLCLDDAFTLDAKDVQREWEYAFASLICEQYSCTIWLPALASLLQRIGRTCNEMPLEFLCALELISQKLQDPELLFKLESPEDAQWIQGILQQLMEHVVSLSPLIDLKGKKMRIPVNVRSNLKECLHAILKNITMVLSPSSYFSGIANLLGNGEEEVQKKALGLLSESIRDHASRVAYKGRIENDIKSSNSWLQLDDDCSRESIQKMCLEIVRIIDDYKDDTDNSLILAAIGAIECLAQSFYPTHAVYSMCLTSIAKGINSPSLAIASSCLRAAGALVNALGPKALAELPQIMENVVKTSRNISSKSDVGDRNITTSSSSEESLLTSILVTLEAVIDKLGGFLSPYLGNIIELVVLHSDYTSELKLKLKVRADRVRMLLAEKIPARLALPSLLKIYTEAVASGDSSVAITFDILANFLVKMDRPSIVGYHGKVFEFCLSALDLRRQQPRSIQNIDDVEKSIISAMISLTMKLTETMFKPLFIRAFEWAESNVDTDGTGGSSIERSISFYGLLDRLAENHRSLFVPYFKYLLESCVRHLSDVRDGQDVGLPRKKKKVKVQEGASDNKGGKKLLLNWHLRALVTSSLHKCFLYDTGDVKFLDTSNFQALMKPIVSQLAIGPPALLEGHSNIPTVKEVDDLLVVCIGQMAVTAGTDLLWKPLNHEVLLQTRSDKARSRILGLRVVKYLLDHLREEYLVLLAETIPFLGELLEDVELPVKTLAQDILKEMESLSGESLRQYLL